MAETHLHHITPRYEGGTDDPSNLIRVSVSEHSELHFSRYLDFGDPRDLQAALGLAGLIGKEELHREACRRGGLSHKGKKRSEETKELMRKPHGPKHTEESRKLISESRKGKKLSEEHKRKISEGGKGKHTRKGFSLSDETKAKLSEAGKGNQRAKGTDQKSKTEANKRRGEATKERWRKWRKDRGLDPDKPLWNKKK